jgi:integrase
VTKRDAGPRRDPKTDTWWFVVDVGRDPKTGKRRQARRAGFATKKAAKDAFDAILREAHENAYTAPKDTRVTLKVVSERLGHSRTGITSDLYQHVSETMGADAAAKVAGLIFRSQQS